jgi:hypothetical protein
MRKRGWVASDAGERMKMRDDGTFEIERNDEVFPCGKCGGASYRRACTNNERAEYGCGRPHDCCSAAFVCRECNHRQVMRLPAPEFV